MGWIGKIIGGTLGFALGGPLGAVFGATFGHAYDSSNVQFEKIEGRTHLSPGQESQLTFFVGVFSMLAKLAKADGHVSQEEVNSVEEFMTRDLHLNPESRNVAVNIFRSAVDSPSSFEQFAAQFYNEFRYRPQFLELMMDILFRVSIADGILSPVEEEMILSAARIFNLSEGQYQTFKSRYIKEDRNTKFYAQLGCSPDDPDERVKSSYRKLVQEYHPDKIASKGLPEEFTKFAAEKFNEIQAAYEAIKKERGIK